HTRWPRDWSSDVCSSYLSTFRSRTGPSSAGTCSCRWISSAAAGHARAADDEIQRHEHVPAEDGPVLERNVEREMAPSDAHPRRVARDQCAGDADVGPAAQQPLGIEHAERQTDDGGHWGEGDV